jgi:arylsulfatase A-like enzyme
MNKLDALQITDNTLVIVCQDHGQIAKDTMFVFAIYPALCSLPHLEAKVCGYQHDCF